MDIEIKGTGEIVQFPDDTSPEVIQQALSDYTATPEVRREPVQSPAESGIDLLQQALYTGAETAGSKLDYPELEEYGRKGVVQQDIDLEVGGYDPDNQTMAEEFITSTTETIPELLLGAATIASGGLASPVTLPAIASLQASKAERDTPDAPYEEKLLDVALGTSLSALGGGGGKLAVSPLLKGAKRVGKAAKAVTDKSLILKTGKKVLEEAKATTKILDETATVFKIAKGSRKRLDKLASKLSKELLDSEYPADKLAAKMRGMAKTNARNAGEEKYLHQLLSRTKVLGYDVASKLGRLEKAAGVAGKQALETVKKNPIKTLGGAGLTMGIL